MTNLQKINLRQSEIRTRLHDLGAVEDLTDEIRGEISTLTTEMKDLEIRSQACIAAGEAPDVEPVGEAVDAQLAMTWRDGPTRARSSTRRSSIAARTARRGSYKTN